MSPGLPTKQGVDYRHFDRASTDGINHLGPATPGYPLIVVGIKRAKPDEAFGGDCSQEQMSQIGPYLSQMGPINPHLETPDWRCPSPNLPGITAIRKGILCLAYGLTVSH